MGVGWMCTEGVLFLSISFLIGREWDVAVWEVEGGLGGKIGGGFSLWIVEI